MKLTFYLAGRYSRKDELALVAEKIETFSEQSLLGDAYDEVVFRVNSRWLTGAHEWSGVFDDDIPMEVQNNFAREDLNDIANADVMICFTEPAGQGIARGGRHVEFGYAIAHNIPVIIIGPRENIFYSLAVEDGGSIPQLETVGQLLDVLSKVKSHAGWGLDPLRLLRGYLRQAAS